MPRFSTSNHLTSRDVCRRLYSFDVKIFDVELGTAITAGSED